MRSRDERATIGHGSDDFAAGLEQLREGFSDQPVIVGQKDAGEIHRRLRGSRFQDHHIWNGCERAVSSYVKLVSWPGEASGTSTSILVPADGRESMEIAPPTRSNLSRMLTSPS